MADLNSDCTATVSFAMPTDEREFDVASYDYADGRKQKVLRRSTKVRRWTVRFETQSQSQINSLRSFYDARYGSYESFYWDPPGTTETNVLVYFDSKLVEEYVSPGVFNASVTLVETFA